MTSTPSDPQDDAIWVPPSARKRAAEPELPETTDEPAEAPAQEPEPEPEVDWHDRYLRAAAEIDNVRRRAAEQARLTVQRGNQALLLGLLPVLDGFRRAVASAEQGATLESLVEGLKLLQGQLASLLQAAEVTPIECEVGCEFDPEYHEAVVRIPATEEVADGRVAAVIEPGYLLAGRVLRPTRVAVAAAAFEAEA